MEFERRKIGDGPQQRQLELKEEKAPLFPHVSHHFSFKDLLKRKKKWHWYFAAPLLVFAFILISNVVLSVYDTASERNFTNKILNPVMGNFDRDENGFINLLLIGQGGDGHDGGDLSDTIIVASIDTYTPNVVMISVPRDMWLDTDKFGASRINEIFRNTKNRLKAQFNIDEVVAREEATKIFMKEVEQIVNMKIPYFARIDFKGFTEIIDEMGGVDVYVEKDIYDEEYPDGNWGVELFELKRGNQTLDGETALKYARSRHGNSDFDRAARQQQVIQALKDKALSAGVLTSPRKIKGVLSVINDNFETNFELSELITLAFLGKNIQRDGIISAVLNDDWNARGGFLGTPPRADYGGAFVLIPYSGEQNYERIHIFTDLLYNYREFQGMVFEVLNGTNRGGLARKASNRLERYGFPIFSIGNTPGDDVYEESELWVYKNFEKFSAAHKQISEIFPIKLVDKTSYYEETDVGASFIIGGDYK